MRRSLLMLVALALLGGVGQAKAGPIVLNFIELPNDGGIQLTGNDANGNLISTTVSGETFVVSTWRSQIPSDFMMQGIGYRNGPILIDILDYTGGPMSDQIYVHSSGVGASEIDFFSSPAAFYPGTPTTDFVETGLLQFGANYTSDSGNSVTVNFQSQPSNVPEPSTLTLLGIASASIAGYMGWRPRRQCATA